MRVLVTGTNRGLGLEFVRQLAARGDRVFATCRRPAEADALQALQRQYPDRVTITALEVADPASIEAAYEDVRSQTDALDVLINNAGVSPGNIPLGQWDKHVMMDTLAANAVGPMLVIQRYVDLLRAGQEPKIINITSGLGSVSMRSDGSLYSYAASKAALNMFTRTLAHDSQIAGIAAIVMDPGWVKTDMGGPNAWITPEQSIREMLAVIDQLTPDQTGQFFHHSGSQVPW